MKTLRLAITGGMMLLFVAVNLYSDWNKPYIPPPEGTPGDPRHKVFPAKKITGGSSVSLTPRRDAEYFIETSDNAPSDTQAENTSVEYSQQVADRILGLAQLNMGIRYETGKELRQDYNEAAYWYRIAAQKGYPEAHYRLGCLYRDGKGVSQSNLEAYKWFWLADSIASSDTAIYRKAMAEIELRLTDRQISTARKQAAACLNPD